MELIQLESFHQIVKTGSFSEASKQVYRSQSAVSHQIKNLERELKVKLFERLGKNVKLTEQGDLVFHIVDEFFRNLDNVKRICMDVQHGHCGKLTITAGNATMTCVLPGVLKKFIAQFPKITLKLITCNINVEIQSLVLKGKVDFGIGIKSNQMISENLNFLFWKSFDILLIIPKDHALSGKKTIKLIDICKYPHILHSKGTLLRKTVEEVYDRNKLVCDVVMEMDTSENIKNYVETGVGIGILSSLTITRYDEERFSIFNLNKLFGKVDLGIYYRKEKYISTAMREFVKLFAPELLGKLVSYEVV
jgi:LysR family cys regulon transcriptional activator